MKFYGREKELNHLTRLYQSLPSFVVITGRRRVGKTELIKEFLKGREGVYFYVDPHKNIDLLIKEYTDILREIVTIPDYIAFSTPEMFLKYLFDIDRPLIVVFDEFQRFADIYPSFISQLQKIWDLKGRDSRLFLIASGSSVGMIRRIFIDTKAPLFRRADSILTLKPFPYRDCIAIMKDLGILDSEERLNIYLLFGGMIYYYHILEKFGCRTFVSALDEVILSDLAPLSGEMSNLLIEEFGGTHMTYYEILGAMAEGRSTMITIADRTHIAPSSLPPYLRELSDLLGIIEYRVQVTEDRYRSKMGRYLHLDPFIRFFCRYIYRNMSLYQSGRYDLIRKKILDEWKGFIGWSFEEMVRELLSPRLMEEYEQIGSWWNRKGDEIDILAIGSSGSHVIEIKNCSITRKEALAIISDLNRKITLVKGITYPVSFGVAARTVEDKEMLRDEGVIIYELDDIIGEEG